MQSSAPALAPLLSRIQMIKDGRSRLYFNRRHRVFFLVLGLGKSGLKRKCREGRERERERETRINCRMREKFED